MSHLSTSGMSFRAEILEKIFPWLYIHMGVYITMEHFREEMLYFKVPKMLHVAVYLFGKMF